MPAIRRFKHNGQYMQNTMTTWPNQYVGSGHATGMFDAAANAQHYVNLCNEFPDQFDNSITDADEQLRLICEHESRLNEQSYREAYAEAFGIPAGEIIAEIVPWDGRNESLPFASDNSAPVQPLPEEQRPGYIAPEPVPPTPLEIIAKALLADPTTSQSVKDAVQQAIAAGGADGGAAIPMTPQANA